jgi:hypothetical protein
MTKEQAREYATRIRLGEGLQARCWFGPGNPNADWLVGLEHAPLAQLPYGWGSPYGRAEMELIRPLGVAHQYHEWETATVREYDFPYPYWTAKILEVLDQHS